jgi:hypothetical protein
MHRSYYHILRRRRSSAASEPESQASPHPPQSGSSSQILLQTPLQHSEEDAAFYVLRNSNCQRRCYDSHLQYRSHQAQGDRICHRHSDIGGTDVSQNHSCSMVLIMQDLLLNLKPAGQHTPGCKCVPATQEPDRYPATPGSGRSALT